MSSLFSNNEINKDNIIPKSFCLRCHGMETLAYRDEITKGIVDLHIDLEDYEHSNHEKLDCVICHKAGYDVYPHSIKTKSENLYCLDCHIDDPRLEKYRFVEIGKEFKSSIHYKNLSDKFSCFSCHDAHNFKVGRDEDNIAQLIVNDNNICLNCHGSQINFNQLIVNEFPVLEDVHNWLPNARLHWKTVRCIECHLPNTENFSHEILPKEDAVKNCVECHTTNSILLTKLYRFQSKEERQKNGFINSIVFNNAYVIGMTRNVLLDRISVILFAATIIGLVMHGGGRWFMHRRQK